MSDKRNYVSQKNKLFFSLIASFAAGILLYLLLSRIAFAIFDGKWQNPQWRQERNLSYAQELQKYVSENEVALNDHEKIMVWRETHPYVVLSIQKEGETVFGTNPEISGISEFFNGTVESFPLEFSDAQAQVYILDQSDTVWRRGLNAGALLLGFLLFAFLFWLMIRHNVQKLVNLSEEVKRIKSDDLEAEITLNGNDEIADIARSVADMRNSLVQKYADEKRAWEANNELIAAVSHDIRTPLTALIGYLDLLKEEKGLSEEQSERYLENSYSKAMQLKDLTDKLFQYFLVYSGRIQIEKTEYDAAMLLDQIIGEHMAYFESFGYQFEFEPFEKSGTISVDTAYLMRVFDNLFSNIGKYASRDEPIRISREISGNMLAISFENRICRTASAGESTRIGLKTCETIMKLLSGEFEYQTDGELFTATVKLPIQTEE